MSQYKLNLNPKEVPQVNTKFRTIKTKIPVLESISILSEMEKREINGMYAHEMPVVWDKAEDFQIYDAWGNKWIDFSSGIFVANVGHSAKRVINAIADKVKQKLLHSYIFPSDIRIKLVNKICEVSNMERALLTVTGSEANDAVIQMMKRNKEGKILSIQGAYYGSTTACRLIAENTIDEEMSPDKFNPNEIAGVFLQAFRGRDANLLPYEWIREWCNWAQKNNIPVGFDEMQSGFARTGKWFGFQNYDIQPDFITIGKAFGGGLPISAVVGKSELLKFSDDLWCTHSGNPVCCASALATLETIESENLVEKTANRTEWFGKALRTALPNNKVYGSGMIWGVYTGDPEITQKVIEKCMEKGLLLVSTHGIAIKIGPPLTIPDEALKEGVEVLKESFEEVTNN